MNPLLYPFQLVWWVVKWPVLVLAAMWAIGVICGALWARRWCSVTVRDGVAEVRGQKSEVSPSAPSTSSGQAGSGSGGEAGG